MKGDRALRLPAITSVLDAFLFSAAGIPPAILKAAADYGTNVHRTIQLHEDGKLRTATLDSLWAAALFSWIELKADRNIQVVATEAVVASLDKQFAGRLDLIADVAGVRSVIELKTRAWNPTRDPLQVAAQFLAWNENHTPAGRAEACYGCILLPGHRARLIPIDVKLHSMHFSVFLSALALYQWREVSKS